LLYRFKLQMRIAFACIKAKGVYNCLSEYVYIYFTEKLHIFSVLLLARRKNVLV